MSSVSYRPVSFDRKSGIPLEVDIPAPARTTMFFLELSKSTIAAMPSEKDGGAAADGFEYSGKGPDDVIVEIVVHVPIAGHCCGLTSFC